MLALPVPSDIASSRTTLTSTYILIYLLPSVLAQGRQPGQCIANGTTQFDPPPNVTFVTKHREPNPGILQLLFTATRFVGRVLIPVRGISEDTILDIKSATQGKLNAFQVVRKILFGHHRLLVFFLLGLGLAVVVPVVGIGWICRRTCCKRCLRGEKHDNRRSCKQSCCGATLIAAASIMTVPLVFAFISYSRLPENIDNIAQVTKEALRDVYNLYKRTKSEIRTLTVTNYANFSDSLMNKLLDCRNDLPEFILSALENTLVLGGLKKLAENMRLIAKEMVVIKEQVTSVNNLLRDIGRRTRDAAGGLQRACALPMQCPVVDPVVSGLRVVTRLEVVTADFDSAKSPIENVYAAVNLRDSIQTALTQILDPVVEDAKNIIKTVGEGLSTINDVFVFEPFASQDKAHAFFEPTRKTLDMSAHYGDLYIALSVFVLLVLSAALVCYLTGLWCIVSANNADYFYLITVGVLLFSITFLLPMITSTLALCLGFVGQRTICDVVSNLRQPEVQTLVRGVMILVEKREESQSRGLRDQPWPPTWPDCSEGRRSSTISSGLVGSYQEASKTWMTKQKSWLVWPVGQRVFSDLWLLRTGMSVSAEVRLDKAQNAEPQLLQQAGRSNVTVSMALAKVMTPAKITEILRRFSECGDKDLSAFNLIGSDTVVELFNLVVPSAQNFSWLFDDTKSTPIKVTKELDRALQDLANDSLDKFVPDLPTLERKVLAIDMTKLNISDVKGKLEAAKPDGSIQFVKTLIGTAMAAGYPQKVTDKLNESSNLLGEIETTDLPRLEVLMDNINTSLDKIRDWLTLNNTPIKDFAQGLIRSLRTDKMQIESSISDSINKTTILLLDKVGGVISDYTTHVTRTLKQNFVSCKPVHTIFSTCVGTVCAEGIGSLNGYWLSVWTYLVAGAVALFAAVCLSGSTNKPVGMDTNSEISTPSSEKSSSSKSSSGKSAPKKRHS